MRILCRIIEVTSFCMRKRSISSTNVVKIHQERNFIRRKTCVCVLVVERTESVIRLNLQAP